VTSHRFVREKKRIQKKKKGEEGGVFTLLCPSYFISQDISNKKPRPLLKGTKKRKKRQETIDSTFVYPIFCQ